MSEIRIAESSNRRERRYDVLQKISSCSTPLYAVAPWNRERDDSWGPDDHVIERIARNLAPGGLKSASLACYIAVHIYGIAAIEIQPYAITVTKAPGFAWINLEPEILAILENVLAETSVTIELPKAARDILSHIPAERSEGWLTSLLIRCGLKEGCWRLVWSLNPRLP